MSVLLRLIFELLSRLISSFGSLARLCVCLFGAELGARRLEQQEAPSGDPLESNDNMHELRLLAAARLEDYIDWST